MAKSIDKLGDIIQEKIKIKRGEIDFLKDKLIVLDNERELPLGIIKSIDKDLVTKIDEVNSKLQAVKTAYQARIDSLCKSDLFWRVVGIRTEAVSTGISSSKDYRTYYDLKCVRLSPNPYPLVSLGASKYSAEQIFSSETYGQPLEPLDDGKTLRYITPSGEAAVPYNTLLGISPDNLHGIKYYDEPYTKDIANTFVSSFPGTVGIGGTIVTVFADQYSGSVDNVKVGQNIICSKNTVFPLGFGEIVAIGTTIANRDTTVEKRQATASSGLSTITRYQLGVISITDGGAGYSSTSDAPTVTIGEPNAVTAIGTAIVSSTGTITSINVTNVGSGYTLAPEITISEPFIISAVGIATTGPLSGGAIVGFTTIDIGFGYPSPPTITFSSPPSIGVGIGTTAEAVATIGAGGTVTSVTITNVGYGYTQDPTVIFSSVGVTTAVAAATTSMGSVNTVLITNSGIGYTNDPLYPPTVTFSDPLKVQAIGISTLSSASTIASVQLTIPGEGYVSAPSVEIESPLDPLTDLLYTLVLKDPVSDSVSQPESDGTYPTFTVLISDQELDQKLDSLGLPFNSTSFTPQTIGIMNTGNVGIGVRIKYDNSGNQSGTRSWRPELKADAIKVSGGTDIPAVTEPSVGAGKIYYKTGLDFYPIKTPGDPNSRASEGETISVLVSQTQTSYYWFNKNGLGPQPLSSYVQACSSCSSTIANNLTNAINEANAAESALASASSDLDLKIAASNAFRDDLMEINAQIWSYRILIGQLNDEIAAYKTQSSYVQNSTIRSVSP